MNPYIHILDGRLRIKVPEVKYAPLKAAEVVRALQSVHGVTHAQANPTTGSVLVLFNSSFITPEQIVQTLRDIGCFATTVQTSEHQSVEKGIGQKLTETVVQSLFETAVQRMIMALI
jgi:copper chaperone CopZ